MNEAERRLLTLAAAGGPAAMSLADMRDVAAALDPPLEAADLLSALDRAVEMRILQDCEGGYAFRQPLVRVAICEGLPRHRRDQLLAALHRSRGGDTRRLRVAASAR
jgi:hypothetical protein